MVLDELSTITGYSETDQSGFWSNEVRNITRDKLTVKTGKGTRAVGLYRDLGEVRGKGAKYAKSIYIAHKDQTGDYVIGNIKASGAALTAWIEFNNTCKPQNGKVRLTGSTDGKKSNTIYAIPTFEYLHIDSTENDIAIELDKQLQIYLNQYLAVNEKAALDQESEIDPDLGKATPEQIKEFEELKARKKAEKIEIEDITPAELDNVDYDIGDDPINIEDIPF